MRNVMVRYKVKPDRAAENERYIEDVFAQLERELPNGLRYASFKLDDGVTFVHFVSHDTEAGRNPLTELSAFKAFTAEIEQRCDERPVVSPLTPVGSYRLVDR